MRYISNASQHYLMKYYCQQNRNNLKR